MMGHSWVFQERLGPGVTWQDWLNGAQGRQLQMTDPDDLAVTSSLEPSSGSLWADGPVTRHRPSQCHSFEC